MSRLARRIPSRGYAARKAGSLGHDAVIEVQVAALKADGAMALAGHIMESLVDLDHHRRALTAANPELQSALSLIECEALRQTQKIQRNLYSGWDL